MSGETLEKLSCEELLDEFESLSSTLARGHLNPKPGGYEEEKKRCNQIKKELLRRLKENKDVETL